MSHGLILAAIDAEPAATAVLRTTFGAASALGTPIRVLSVLEPLPRLLPGRDIAVLSYISEERERLTALHNELRARMAGEAAAATITFCMSAGGAAATIRAAASEWGARLVVLGHGRRALIDRAFGAGVALKVARDAPAPVLVVPNDAPARPSSIIALVDFSRASRSAAHLAADLANEGGTLHLLHTSPEVNKSLIDDREWRTVYETGACDLAGALREELLTRRPDLRVNVLVRAGHPAESALALADETHAQLIATGRHTHDLFERLVLGTVSTSVLQSARCAVLVAPPLPDDATASP